LRWHDWRATVAPLIKNMIQLRPYQQQAVEKLLWSQVLDGADICVLPTGSGKSLVIAELAHRINKPILILQPTKEILEQNVGKMIQYVPEEEIGIYSASMARKDHSKFTFATIQSIYKKPEEFMHYQVVLIDECHLVNPKNLDGMFTSFLREIGNPKVVGLTATPYRMDHFYTRNEYGTVFTHTTTKLINRLREHFWHRIIYNVNCQDLIDQGYLVPLKYMDRSIFAAGELKTNISHSDYDMNDFDRKMDQHQTEMLEAVYLAREYGKHNLVFCSSVHQASELCDLVDNSAVVTAETSKKERECIIREFRSGKLPTVFNVGVLTTGFDFPELDTIVLLRPTMSIGLYYQMLGRGVRKAPGKEFCRVIDMTGTVKMLGRIETIKMVKENLWELKSETGSWHNAPLYEFALKNA
jgi:DNA repair protein RadD